MAVVWAKNSRVCPGEDQSGSWTGGQEGDDKDLTVASGGHFGKRRTAHGAEHDEGRKFPRGKNSQVSSDVDRSCLFIRLPEKSQTIYLQRSQWG